MLRSLKNVAHTFAEATNIDAVFAALDAIVGDMDLRVLSVSERQTGAANPTIFFGPEAPAGFEAASRAGVKRFGPTVVWHMARQAPPPFTVTEAMRTLQPTGTDRWIFDLFREFGLRDGYRCASNLPWVAAFSCDHVLKGAELSQEVRMALDAATIMATDRMKELTGLTAPAAVALSTREKTMLQHLSDGMTASQIAERLKLTEATVRTFITRSEKKLGANNQLHAVSIAIRLRLI